MAHFQYIQQYLTAGYLLEVRTIHENGSHDGQWQIRIATKGGMDVGPVGRPFLHLMMGFIEQENALSGKRRLSFKRERDHDSFALSIFRRMHVVITASSRGERFQASLDDHESNIPRMVAEADCAVFAVMQVVTSALCTLAAMHQARFHGH